MSIKANTTTDVNGNITIHMDGGLNYDNSSPLHLELEAMTTEHPTVNITLDLHHLDFVGSSGIGNFIETIENINKRRGDKIRIANLKPEFMKVFNFFATDLDALITDQFENDEVPTMTSMFGAPKSRTFEN